MPQFGSLLNIPSLTKIPNQYKIKDPSTGSEFMLDWNNPTPPTDDDIDEILSKHNLTANDQNIADATKPEGKSHGAVADFAWNVGKRIADIPAQLYEASPIGQHAKTAATLNELDKKYPNDPVGQRNKLGSIFDQSNQELEQQAKSAISNPWEMAKTTANVLDPTGIVPGYMGLGEMTVKDIKNEDYPGLTSDAILAAAPWLIGKGLGKLAGRRTGPGAPIETPPKQLYSQTTDAGAPVKPAAPRALLGPAREPPTSTQRFTVDPNTGRAIDLQDPSTVNTFDSQKQTGLSAFGKGDTVYPSPPKLPRVEPVSGDPFKANAMPPIDELPTVDESVIHPAIRAAKVVPDVAPITEQGLTTTGPIDTSLPQSKIVRGFRPPQDVTAWPGAEPPKVVGAGSTIPRTGLWNRFLGDSGEYEVGKATTELQKMKEEWLRKREEAKNLPPVEPIAGMGRTAQFPPAMEGGLPKLQTPQGIEGETFVQFIKRYMDGMTPERYNQLPGDIRNGALAMYKESQAKVGGNVDEVGRLLPPDKPPEGIAESSRPEGMSESDAIDSENIRTNRIRDLSVVPMKGDFTEAFKRIPAAADFVKTGIKHIAGFDKHDVTVELNDGRTLIVGRENVTGIHPEASRSYEAGKVEHYPVLNPEKFDKEGNLKSKELPPVEPVKSYPEFPEPGTEKPQKMSVPLPEREPVTPPSELTHPIAVKLAKAVIKLDGQGVPDEAYGKILSGSRALKPGETWRSRALDYIDHYEEVAMDNPSKFGNARLGTAKELPKVEPVTAEPIATQPGELPTVEPIEAPKVIGRGRKPLFAGKERVPRKEWPSLTQPSVPEHPIPDVEEPQSMASFDKSKLFEEIARRREAEQNMSFEDKWKEAIKLARENNVDYKKFDDLDKLREAIIKAEDERVYSVEDPTEAPPHMSGEDMIRNIFGDHPSDFTREQAWEPHEFDTPEIAKKRQELKAITEQTGDLTKSEQDRIDQLFNDIDEYDNMMHETSQKEPQAMAKIGEGRAQIGVNVRHSAAELTSGYSNPLPHVMAREGIQNALDATNHLGPDGLVNVKMVSGRPGRKGTLEISDNGKGMTPEDLYTVYTDLHSSGKTGDITATGGKGVGKAPYILGGDHFEVTTVTEVNGKKIQSNFSGTPEELLSGFDVNSQEVDPKTPTGTKFKTTLKDEQDVSDANSAVDAIRTYSRDKNGVLRVIPYEGATPQRYRLTGNPGDNVIAKDIPIDGKNNNADIVIPHNASMGNRSMININYLNNGMWQFRKWMHLEEAVNGIPDRVTVNLKPKVDELSKEYPFPVQRESVKSNIEAAIEKAIKDKLVNPFADKKKIDLVKLWDAIKTDPAGAAPNGAYFNRESAFFDSGDRLTPQETAHVNNSPAIRDMKVSVDTMLEDILQNLGKTYEQDKLVRTGLMMHQAEPGKITYGIHIPNPAAAKTESAILINPFEHIDAHPNDPATAALQMVETAFHEAAHIGANEPARQELRLDPGDLTDPRIGKFLQSYLDQVITQGGLDYGHSMPFIRRLGEIYATSGPTTFFHHTDILHDILTGGRKSGGYSPEIQKLLQIYKESRGRDATTEDILSGTGIKSEHERPTGEGNIPSDVNTAGEGVTRPKRPKIIKSLREGVASKEQIENELASEGLPAVEPVQNWGGEPKTVTLEGKGKKLRSGKANKFEYPSEADIPDVASAPVKKPLSERLGIESTGETKPAFESGKGYIDPNKIDVVYPDREFIKGKGNVDRIMGEREAEKAAESTPSFKDPGGFKANYASPHKTLSSNPLTEPIASNIVQAYDKKIQWVRAKLESAAPFISKLGKSDRGLLGKALDTGDLSNLTPELAAKAKGLKNLLDQIHTEFPENKNVGYIKNYFTHIADEPKEGMARSIINLFKDSEVKTGKGVGSIGDFYEQGLGTPDSPYIKKRTGALKNINYDVKTVLPQYLDSIAKVIFDQPAVEKAKTYLKHVPEGSNLRDLASWYIKNYTRYDSEAALHKAFTSPVSKVANATARSFIDFNPGLHALHLGELPVNIWPELGSKYTKHGIKEVTLNPLRTWTETSKLGLIQGETKPFAFKTVGERWQSVAYFLNTAEKFVKGVGYEGAKKMYLDQGFSPEEASRKAVELTKDMTLDTGPARQLKGLSNESNTAGGEVSSRLGGQFKGIPIKIAEQMYNVAKNARANPKAALRMAAGAAAMIYATKKGAHLFHLDPASLARTTALGAFGTAAANFTSALYRGDYETAVEDAASWAIPGGQAAKKIYESVTDKPARDKELAKQREKEAKSFNPPVNTLKRTVDYMFKGS